jgi:hypothetical protein
MNSATIENAGEDRKGEVSKLTRKSSDSSVEVEEKEEAVVRFAGKRSCRGEDAAGEASKPKPVGVCAEVQTEVSFTPLAQARVDALEFASEVMRRSSRGEDAAGEASKPKPVGVCAEVQTEVSFTPLAQARVEALEFASEVMRLRVIEADHRRREVEQRAAELERASAAKDARIAELERLLAAVK